MSRKILILAAALLAACQSPATQMSRDMIFVRTDGKRSADGPQYAQQFEIDRQICMGEVSKAAVGAPIVYWDGLMGAIAAQAVQDNQTRALIEVLKGCMASRGYVLVPKSEAAAVSASFRKS